MISSTVKEAVRTTFRRCWGKELIRSDQHPASNLMGLRHLGIRTLLDIGANTGQFASEAVQWFPGVRLYSFEPIPGAFAALNATSFPGTREFRALNYALGETNGEVEMNETVNDTTSSSLLQTTRQFTSALPRLEKQALVKVRMGRLDDVVREEKLTLEPEILIKMDVQGFEDRVIRGGSETFARARACIVEVILDSYYVGQGTFLEIAGLLHRYGLHYAGNFGQYHDPDGHVAVIDAYFQRGAETVTAPPA